MVKKKVTPIVDEEAENPAPASEGGLGEVGKPKRIRRSKAQILIDKINALYAKYDEEEVKTALDSAVEAIKELDSTAQKFKKKSAKAFSIRRIARFRTKEELQAMMLQLQEAIKSKEE